MKNLSLRVILLSLIVVSLFLADCSQGGQDRALEKTNGGYGRLTGTVLFTGVACQPDRLRVPPCDGPYPGFGLTIFNEDGKTVAARTAADDKGEYALKLPEGNYVLFLKEFSATSGMTEVPHRIKLEAGKTKKYDIIIDTGIR